ncbi:unnamed protein product, partial [Iphiclides podalirius]
MGIEFGEGIERNSLAMTMARAQYIWRHRPRPATGDCQTATEIWVRRVFARRPRRCSHEVDEPRPPPRTRTPHPPPPPPTSSTTRCTARCQPYIPTIRQTINKCREWGVWNVTSAGLATHAQCFVYFRT